MLAFESPGNQTNILMTPDARQRYPHPPPKKFSLPLRRDLQFVEHLLVVPQDTEPRRFDLCRKQFIFEFKFAFFAGFPPLHVHPALVAVLEIFPKLF